MRRIFHSLIMLLLMASAAIAQDRPSAVPAKSATDEAMAVLIATYPELQQGRIGWTIAMVGDRLVLVARQRQSPFEAIASDAPMLLRAQVTIDETGRLRSMQIDGAAAKSQELATARASATIQRDPDEGLRAARARVPPSATEASEALVTDGLRRLLKIAEADPPRFTKGSARVDAVPDETPSLTWEASALGKDDDGREVSYTFAFEPFNGRLVSVVRR
jgi:hypothetical protein